MLGELLEKHGLGKQVRRMEILDLWPELVGEPVARVTKARGVEEKTLFVEVRSSAWLMELNMMKDEILQKLNPRLEETPLERIVFVLAETE